MKQYEFSARTQDEAVEMGLQELGVSIADVDIQVVEEGSKGLFGLFGSRPVKVRLTLKDAEEDPLADLLEDKKPAKPQIEPEKKQEKKAEKKAEKKPVAEKKAEEKKPSPEKKKAEKKAEPAEKKEQEKPAVKAEIRPMEKPEVTMIAAEELTDDSPAGTAHAFLAELTSLKVNRGREGYTRVTLDTENYRAKREDTLIRLANRMANRALRTGRKVSLEPMNPYERRIIHYALQQTEGVTTHSEGEEPNRHVVITNKK